MGLHAARGAAQAGRADRRGDPESSLCWTTLSTRKLADELTSAGHRVGADTATRGVVAAAVPWARHGTGHTYAFDDTVAWLTVPCSKTAVRELMRVAWRTVGSIITRVSADAMTRTDRFANLSRIGIDEISYKRGHR